MPADAVVGLSGSGIGVRARIYASRKGTLASGALVIAACDSECGLMCSAICAAFAIRVTIR